MKKFIKSIAILTTFLTLSATSSIFADELNPSPSATIVTESGETIELEDGTYTFDDVEIIVSNANDDSSRIGTTWMTNNGFVERDAGHIGTATTHYNDTTENWCSSYVVGPTVTFTIENVTSTTNEDLKAKLMRLDSPSKYIISTSKASFMSYIYIAKNKEVSVTFKNMGNDGYYYEFLRPNTGSITFSIDVD